MFVVAVVGVLAFAGSRQAQGVDINNTKASIHHERKHVTAGAGDGSASAAHASSSWGLMTDLKPSPSLGVSTRPTFSWIVPTTLSLGAGQRQTACEGPLPSIHSDVLVSIALRLHAQVPLECMSM